MTTDHPQLDVAGVGVGPANLSLAALLADSSLAMEFVDRKASFDWHPGLMLPEAQMQVHFLKDLVTAVDPTSRFSFPAFLVQRKRFYRLLITGRNHVPRREFEQYCQWVADQLPALRFGVNVDGVDWDGERFVLHTGVGPRYARHLVCGIGRRPLLPSCALSQDPERVFHADRLLSVPRDLGGLRVAVVGGGQSGAEVVQYLLGLAHPPAHILWGTSRHNLLPLDESPFVEELFLPNHSRYFRALPAPERERRLTEQQMASDGVSESLLDSIYRRLYDLELLEGRPGLVRILLGHRMIGMERTAGGLRTVWRATHVDTLVRHPVDVVICATGYRNCLPDVLAGLADRMPSLGGRPRIGADFAVQWDGAPGNRIYLQNATRQEFGVSDPNLSLLPWRSALIANSLLGHQRYQTGEVSAAIEWLPGAGPGDPPPDELPLDELPLDGLPVDERAVHERAVHERAVHERAVDERAVDQPAADQRVVDQLPVGLFDR